MAKQFLDYEGLKTYDDLIKKHIDEKTDEVKEYINIDELNEKYVQKVTEKLNNAPFVYTNDANDKAKPNTLHYLGNSPNSYIPYNIPMLYGNAAGGDQPGGYLITHTPAKDYHCANKKYVDDKCGWKLLSSLSFNGNEFSVVVNDGKALMIKIFTRSYNTVAMLPIIEGSTLTCSSQFILNIEGNYIETYILYSDGTCTFCDKKLAPMSLPDGIIDSVEVYTL